MRMRSDEAGFFLQETILLGALLLFMAGAFLAYAKMVHVEAQDACRMQAIFLAREELACLAERADVGALHAGEWGWLGERDQLVTEQGQFSVSARVFPLESAGAYRAAVSAAWQNASGAGSLSLEREVYRHAR